MQGEDGTDRGARKIKQLHDNANYFRARLQQLGLHVLGDWDSPVMPIMVYHLCYISGISRRCLEVCACVCVCVCLTRWLQEEGTAQCVCWDAAYSRQVVADTTCEPLPPARFAAAAWH